MGYCTTTTATTTTPTIHVILLLVVHHVSGQLLSTTNHTVLRCVQCNRDGSKPGECSDTRNSSSLCDPEDASVKQYIGCAVVIGVDARGEKVVSKGCVADSTVRCYTGFARKKISFKGTKCLAPMDEKTSRRVQDCWKYNRMNLMTKHHKIDKLCYCDDWETCSNDALLNAVKISGKSSGCCCSTHETLLPFIGVVWFYIHFCKVKSLGLQ